jgi:hypothetical protein
MRRSLVVASAAATVLTAMRVLAADAPNLPAQPSPPAADENKDLDLIPAGAQAPPGASGAPPTVARPDRRVYVENAFTASLQRDDLLVPPPPPPSYNWQDRLLLDWREEWRLGDAVRLTFSDRFNLRFENDIPFPSQANVINELRELYASAEPAARRYVDVGRVNVKSGIALGYNPTDYFKTRAVVEPLSLDPTVLRENRLGTVMVRAQQLWQQGSLTAAFAPALSAPVPIYNNLELPSFNPMLGLTNAETRLLLKGSVNVASNFSPEFLLFRGGGETRIGFNIAENVSPQIVTYLEWSGGRQGSLVSEALRFGRETGTLPANAPSVLPAHPHDYFINQLAVGASYTTQARLTLNLEFHFNQAGFTASDWNRWFAVGQAGANMPTISAELWYLREYALDQQQPVTRDSLFLRADWVDAFVPRLELVGFIDTDLHDGSSLVQVSADYYLSDRWTLGALALGSLGGRRSNVGSLPQAASLLVSVKRYF